MVYEVFLEYLTACYSCTCWFSVSRLYLWWALTVGLDICHIVSVCILTLSYIIMIFALQKWHVEKVTHLSNCHAACFPSSLFTVVPLRMCRPHVPCDSLPVCLHHVVTLALAKPACSLASVLSPRDLFSAMALPRPLSLVVLLRLYCLRMQCFALARSLLAAAVINRFFCKYLYFPVLFCLSVSVKWLAVKTASEMTYTVSSGALISTPTNHCKYDSRSCSKLFLCELLMPGPFWWHIVRL